MIKILFTRPRSGSYLCSLILSIDHSEPGFEMWHGDVSKPKPFAYFLDQIHEHHGVWTHYPYTQEAASYFRKHDHDYELYVNLRDPRDTIVSVAHALMGKKQRAWWWNYKHGDRVLSDMPLEKRIDYLIDDMHDGLYRHDKWRTCGLCIPMYYSENVRHEMAKINQSHKSKGIVGSYKDEMTAEQIERATDMYSDLIESWSERK